MGLAAPEIVVMAAFMICGFLIALNFAYGYTFGAFLDWIAAKIRGLSIGIPHVTTIGFGFLATPFEAANNAIRHALGVGIEATKHAGLYMWHYSAYAIDEVGKLLESLAVTTYNGIDHALHIHIPKWVNNRLRHMAAQLAAAQATIAAFPHRVNVAVANAEKTLTADIAHARAAAIGATLPRIRTAEHDISDLSKRIAAQARKLTAAGFLALLVAGLTTLGINQLRCDRVRKSLGRICSMHPSRLESLLEDTLMIASIISIVELAKELQAIEGEVVKGLRAGVKEI